MYKLFLDDERVPKQVTWMGMPLGPWVIVRNYDAFVAYITKNGVPAFVSFDHDLADEHYRKSMYAADKHYTNYYTDGTFKEKTGFSCAKWLCEYCIDKNVPFPEYQVHSLNPIGRENVTALVENFKKHHDTSIIQK